MSSSVNDFYAFGRIPADKVTLYATIGFVIVCAIITGFMLWRERRKPR